jgi:hypothetical protein
MCQDAEDKPTEYSSNLFLKFVQRYFGERLSAKKRD